MRRLVRPQRPVIMAGYGAREAMGELIELADLRSALDKAFNHDGPALVEVMTDSGLI